MTRITATIGAVLVPTVAAAHPNHFAGAETTVAHYLTDPFHVALVCVAGLLAAAAARSLLRRRVQ